MRLLIAGGTSFIGRATALAAVAEGHAVTVVNRGVTPSDLPGTVEHLIGDRQGDLRALEGRSFDATVDTIAYRPGDVAALHTALGDRGGLHLQISSVSAYEDPDHTGATEESASLWPIGSVEPDAPLTGESYGPLKAECERAATQYFGSDIVIVRPTYVIGGHDATLRFPYWVERALCGGELAVPGPRNSSMQYIDARDLGEFVVKCVAAGAPGAFTAAGPWPATGFVEMVEAILRHVGPDGSKIVEVFPHDVEAAGLDARFPLWPGGTSVNMMCMDPSKALAAGLSLRALEESVDDVMSWWGDRPWPEHWLRQESEAKLLANATAPA
jgi:2'-hydroxyisoflavone reductase